MQAQKQTLNDMHVSYLGVLKILVDYQLFVKETCIFPIWDYLLLFGLNYLEEVNAPISF